MPTTSAQVLFCSYYFVPDTANDLVKSFTCDALSGVMKSPGYLPGIETPERECWYINMGAVDKAFFTTQAMVKMSEVGHM